MIKLLSDIVAEAKEGEHCLTIEESMKLVNSCDNPLLLDVREPTEHSLDYVEGFINIPRGVLEMKLPELCDNPDRCILIHCATGGRAALSANALRKMGYKNVHLINATFEDIKKNFHL